MLVMLFLLHLLIAKERRDAPAIATSDIWENLVTLTMLGAPTAFPASLALLASTLSTVKWSWSVIGTSMVAVQLVALAWHRIGGSRCRR